MAPQRFAWGITVMIVLVSSACRSSAISSSVIRGQDESPGSWPWHVAFTAKRSILCLGSLITDQWVLTSAFIPTVYNLSATVVYLGAYNQSEYGKVTGGVDSTHCHPDYNIGNRENDICLVKLAAPVNFTVNIQKIDLASENITFNVGTMSWFTGYNSSSTPVALQEVDVSVIGNDQCNSIYSFNSGGLDPITKNKMCTGTKPQLTSYIGSALVTKQGSSWFQSGILSSGNTDKPYVYTRVSQYQKWINDTVTGMRPGFVTFTPPGNDSNLNYTYPTPAPTTTLSSNYPPPTTNNPPPTTNYPPPTTNYPHPTTNYHHSATNNSIFGSGETLIPITRFFPLSLLLLLLHHFVGAAGI